MFVFGGIADSVWSRCRLRPVSGRIYEPDSKKGLGMTGILDDNGILVGVFTDGDLRRILDNKADIHATSVSEVMTKGGKTIQENELAVEAINLMESHKISALFVTNDENRAVGAFNMHMLLKAGVL